MKNEKPFEINNSDGIIKNKKVPALAKNNI